MKKTDLAIEKLTKECEGKDYLIPFEEYLTSICTNDYIAEKILDEKKTLEGCFNEMRNIASKRQVNRCACIPPDEGYEIIRKYYEISDEGPQVKEAEVINILDFM